MPRDGNLLAAHPLPAGILPCGVLRCWRDFAPVPSPCGRPLELAGRLPESRYRKRSLSQGQRRHPLRERGRWRGYRRRDVFRFECGAAQARAAGAAVPSEIGRGGHAGADLGIRPAFGRGRIQWNYRGGGLQQRAQLRLGHGSLGSHHRDRSRSRRRAGLTRRTPALRWSSRLAHSLPTVAKWEDLRKTLLKTSRKQLLKGPVGRSGLAGRAGHRLHDLHLSLACWRTDFGVPCPTPWGRRCGERPTLIGWPTPLAAVPKKAQKRTTTREK